MVSLAYSPTDAFSYKQLLLDTLVSFTSNNTDAYSSLVTRLYYAARLLKDSGHKFSTRLPDVITEFAAEMEYLPQDAVPSLEDLKSDDYMSVTNPATAITSSSSKRGGSLDGNLTGTTQEKILQNLSAQERAGDERNLVTGSSTKRNSSLSKNKAGPEKALTEAAREELLQVSSIQKRAEDQSDIISDPFTDADEDHVYNAGLVLLWPYFPRLFRNLEMIDDNNFIDVDTAERAALLLQYLIEPDTEIPESLLSLNKLLCGFELSWPLPSDFTPTEKERIESDALLKAVSCHWDVLKNMSFERIRVDFFQRQGVLRPRDGNWLLQVEQQTHDILMRKLPWPIGVVKLPWMDCTLLVHWD